MIAKLYREIAAGIEAAAKSERTLRANWLLEMESAFGPSLNKLTLINTIEKARTSALDAGVAQSTGSGLANALEQIRPTQFDAALAAARDIVNCENALDVLPNFGRGSRPAVEAGSNLRIATEVFLDTVERNMEVFTGDQTAVSGDLQGSIDSIEKSLDEISQDLNALQMRGAVTNAC